MPQQLTVNIASEQELLAMSFDALQVYRARLEAHRVAFREETQKVGERFRDVNNAINHAARLSGDETALRATPGVALAKMIREGLPAVLKPAHEKGGSIMAEALAPAPDPADKPASSK